MAKQKLNVDIIKQRILEKFNGKYEFVNFVEYIDARQKEEIKHPVREDQTCPKEIDTANHQEVV